VNSRGAGYGETNLPVHRPGLGHLLPVLQLAEELVTGGGEILRDVEALEADELLLGGGNRGVEAFVSKDSQADSVIGKLQDNRRGRGCVGGRSRVANSVASGNSVEERGNLINVFDRLGVVEDGGQDALVQPLGQDGVRRGLLIVRIGETSDPHREAAHLLLVGIDNVLESEDLLVEGVDVGLELDDLLLLCVESGFHPVDGAEYVFDHLVSRKIIRRSGSHDAGMKTQSR